MGLFSSKPKQTDVEVFQERSTNIIGVFTKTADDLRAVNEEMKAAKKEKVEVIQQLETEVRTLDETSAKNSSIIDKIEKLLA